MQHLLDRGVTSLHVRKEDEETWLAYIERHIDAIVSDDRLPRQQKCRHLHESAARVARDLFCNPNSADHLLRAAHTARALAMAIQDDGELVWSLLSLVSNDGSMCAHSVKVAALLIAATREILGIDDLDFLQRVGLGGLLHDIGKSRVPGYVLEKPGPLTAEEFCLVQRHPAEGLELVRRHTSVCSTAAAVIGCHHERHDGGGYPRGLFGQDVAPVARLAKIIDCFDAMTTDRCYAAALSARGALVNMKELAGHFDPELLDGFIHFVP
jgi:putative nucleotidyltransferase with HDIG domain